MQTKVDSEFDLAVCYRIYPRVSGNPIFGFKDKLALTQLNLETFKAAVSGRVGVGRPGSPDWFAAGGATDHLDAPSRRSHFNSVMDA